MPDGFIQRLRRRRDMGRRQVINEALREAEVGECSECGNVYPWNKLTNFSTQEYYKVLCPRCIANHDPRTRG